MRWSLITTALTAVLTAFPAPLVAAEAQERKLWGFTGAKLVVARKGDTAPKSSDEFTPFQPIRSPVTLSTGEVLRLSLTLQAGDEPAVPHQAYLLMKQVSTGVETFFPLDIQPTTAKAKVEVAQKEIPPSFILSDSPLTLSLAIGDFTASIQSILVPVAQIQLKYDSVSKGTASKLLGPTPVVYAPLPEIHHTFRPDPKNPPKIITLVFLSTVLAALAGLFVSWAALGANLSALPKAVCRAPVAHMTFFGSLLAMEGICFMYYSSWNLFQTLIAVGVVAPVAFLTGSRALREVRERRLKGAR
ncbi:oligosaccharyltransferase subunit ribophorin [Kalaharituber pfeilii]|nr:oligosaccharyltransferase subunit ribophorin [Kalaharituber pfeilii]